MTDLTNTQQPVTYKIFLVGDDCIDVNQFLDLWDSILEYFKIRSLY
jgi:hypothetical protein